MEDDDIYFVLQVSRHLLQRYYSLSWHFKSVWLVWWSSGSVSKLLPLCRRRRRLLGSSLGCLLVVASCSSSRPIQLALAVVLVLALMLIVLVVATFVVTVSFSGTVLLCCIPGSWLDESLRSWHKLLKPLLSVAATFNASSFTIIIPLLVA